MHEAPVRHEGRFHRPRIVEDVVLPAVDRGVRHSGRDRADARIATLVIADDRTRIARVPRVGDELLGRVGDGRLRGGG